jgi:mannose-6-phosphate isomerase-like protein (cupin superfamily)
MSSSFYFNFIYFFLYFGCASSVFGQFLGSPQDVKAEIEFENIHIQKWNETQQTSTFIIWVKNEVKPHFHEMHTEHVLVLEGEGIMLLGDSLIQIKKEMLLVIPPKTIHAVHTTSNVPLKVVSIQSPQFDGSDRVWSKSKHWPPSQQRFEHKSSKSPSGY